jgi:hypothetical protein
MKSFTNWLSEVKQHHLDKIQHDVDPKYLNMDHVFGDKLRIAVNINGTEDPIFQFIRLFKDATQHQLTLDEIRNGTVTQQVTTQQGDKTRTLTIGNFLKRNKRTDLMDMWSQVKDRIQNANTTDDFSIIISRSPTDLLRMSDHVHDDGHQIQSCHSPGNGWFHCAIEEAKTGGAIAYAVPTQQLLSVKLQDKEIFKDKDRNKDGIIPLERVRLRRFTIGGAASTEILIPELRTYPATQNYTKRKTVPGFREAVVKWAKETQQAAIEKINKTYGDPKKAFAHADLRGGSYQDNKAGELWSDFFGVNTFGIKKSIDQSKSGSKDDDEHEYLAADEWEDQAREFVHQHEENWNYKDVIDVNFSATDPDDHDADAWGTWNAVITFEIDHADLTQIPDTSTGDAIKGLTDYIRAAGHKEINRFQISKGGPHHTFIKAKMKDHESDGTLESFESFLDDINQVDEDYDRIFSYIKAFLAHKGYMHTDITQKHKDMNFKNLQFELNTKAVGNQGHYYLRSQEIPIGTLANYPSDKDYISATSGRLWMPWELIEYLNILPPLPLGVRVDRQAFFTLFNDHTYGDYALNTKVINNEPLDPARLVGVLYSFNIQVDEQNEVVDKTFGYAKQLDEHFEQVNEQLKQWWNTLKEKLKEYHDKKTADPTHAMPTKKPEYDGHDIFRKRLAAYQAARKNNGEQPAP